MTAAQMLENTGGPDRDVMMSVEAKLKNSA